MPIVDRLSLLRGAVSRDPQRRYESRYSLLSAVAGRLGHRLYNSNLTWVDDADYTAAWGAFPAARPEIKDRKFVLWSFAKATANLSGDTAECGVFDGGSSFLMCLARANEPGWSGLHHLFDSFEGLSEPSATDVPSHEHTYRWKKHDLAVSEAVVLRNLEEFQFVRSHPGWIPTRFEEVAQRRFSFVHVDVDLYEPTRDSLEFFYERLVPGGVLLCDDYGSSACPGATKAFDEYISSRPERSVIHLPTGQGFIVKRPA